MLKINGREGAPAWDVTIAAGFTADLAGPKPGRTSAVKTVGLGVAVASSGLRTVRSRNRNKVWPN